MIDKAGRAFVEAKLGRQILGREFWLVAFRRSEFANRDRLCPWVCRLVEALLDNGQAPRQIAIIDQLADAQVIILENFEPALLLYAVVVVLRAPAHHGLFVAP